MITAIKDLYEVDNPERESKQFFNDGMKQWMIDVKKNGSEPLRDTSYATMEAEVNLYVKPYFEGLLIKDVDDKPCRKMMNSLLTKGYSRTVISHAYIHTNEYFEYLIMRDVISKNWMKFVGMSKRDTIEEHRENAGKKSKKRHYLSTEEIQKFRNAAYNGYEAPQASKKKGDGTAGKHTVKKEFYQPEAYDLLLMTGLRVGELVALTYKEWDEQNETLNIKKGRVSYIDREGDKNKYVTSETLPKSKASKAVLNLSEEANDILKIMKSKEPDGYNGYIVHDKKHNPITVNSFQGRFKRVANAAGLKRVSPHDFRHTYTSILTEKTGGNFLYVSKKLRHKNPETTLNIYADLRKETEEEIDKKVKILP